MTRDKAITFGAVGDIAFHKEVADEMNVHGADWAFAKMKRQLARADVLFGNMESVAIPKSYPKAKIDPRGLVSSVPGPAGVRALRRAGFDFLNMAANHVLDAGQVGLDYTQRVLEAEGIVTGGVGRTPEKARALKTVRKHGITFGFLCYVEDNNYTLGNTHAGIAYYEPDAVVEDVRRHRDAVDVLVVSVHADIEFMPTPSVPRLAGFRRIAAAGADIVLGHHPHVPQGCEMVGGCLIAYSLGNFVFNAHTSPYLKGNGPHTWHSFVLLVKVTKDGVRSFERVPFEIHEPPEQRPHPQVGRARRDALDYLERLDRYLRRPAFVRKTWRKVAKRHLGIYLKRAVERDLDNLIEELVGRLWLTAENRSWMDEVLAMGREAWEARNAQEPDPLHRPHYRFTRGKSLD